MLRTSGGEKILMCMHICTDVPLKKKGLFSKRT